MIKYPYLRDGAVIGVTAPSSGVKQACGQMEAEGFKVASGETAWTHVEVGA